MTFFFSKNRTESKDVETIRIYLIFKEFDWRWQHKPSSIDGLIQSWVNLVSKILFLSNANSSKEERYPLFVSWVKRYIQKSWLFTPWLTSKWSLNNQRKECCKELRCGILQCLNLCNSYVSNMNHFSLESQKYAFRKAKIKVISSSFRHFIYLIFKFVVFFVFFLTTFSWHSCWNISCSACLLLFSQNSPVLFLHCFSSSKESVSSSSASRIVYFVWVLHFTFLNI